MVWQGPQRDDLHAVGVRTADGAGITLLLVPVELAGKVLLVAAKVLIDARAGNEFQHLWEKICKFALVDHLLWQ